MEMTRVVVIAVLAACSGGTKSEATQRKELAEGVAKTQDCKVEGSESFEELRLYCPKGTPPTVAKELESRCASLKSLKIKKVEVMVAVAVEHWLAMPLEDKGFDGAFANCKFVDQGG
jgi:hypothetical protein